MCLLLKLVRWFKVKSNKLQKKFLTLAHICFSCMLFLVEQPYLFSFRLCIWRLCLMTIWRLNYTTFIKLRWLLVTRFLMQAHLAHMKLLFVETKSYCTFLSLNKDGTVSMFAYLFYLCHWNSVQQPKCKKREVLRKKIFF